MADSSSLVEIHQLTYPAALLQHCLTLTNAISDLLSMWRLDSRDSKSYLLDRILINPLDMLTVFRLYRFSPNLTMQHREHKHEQQT